jgi:hypothetical protein
MSIPRFLLAILCMLSINAVLPADETYTVSEERTSSPVATGGPATTYINDEGAFFLAGQDGTATYSFQGKGHWSQLTFVKAASLRGPNFIDQGLIYKDKDDSFFLYFSTIPLSQNGSNHHRLYYSYDGIGFTRWLTESGTTRYEADADAAGDLRRLVTSAGTAGPESALPAPDGNKTVYPLVDSASVDGGRAEVTVLPEGIVKIMIRGRHSGFSGRTRYSCLVVLSGYKDGEEHVILNRLDTQTLTVGANQLSQTAEKDKVFVQENAFNLVDRNNIRNVRILLEKDRSGDNFVDAVIGMIQSAGMIFDEAEALYKKVKESEIGNDVKVAAAAGG